MTETALVVVSAVLAHATYLTIPPERWAAHRELMRVVAVIVVRRVRHHGRWVWWQVIILCRVPRRHINRASRDDV